MSGSVRPPRKQPVPPPPDASVPGAKHKPVRQAKEGKAENPFFDLDQVASATECTGMLAAQVWNGDEAENVSSLEGIHQIKPAEPHEQKPH